MLDGRPLDLAGAVAVCVAPVPAGVGELTWTFGLQATIAAPAARMATGRAKLDFMSDPIGIVGRTETGFASTPEDGTIPMRAERGKKNGSPRGCRSSCLLIWNCPPRSTPQREQGEIAGRGKRRSAADGRRSSCPSWDRTRTLLIQSQACCQLHQGAVAQSL